MKLGTTSVLVTLTRIRPAQAAPDIGSVPKTLQCLIILALIDGISEHFLTFG
jgi:hypothetical protein